MPEKKKFASTRAHMGDYAYQQLKTVLHLSETNKEAAKRLGISDRTLRRWKAQGVPAKSQQVYGTKISRVAGALKAAQARKAPEQQREPRPYFYYKSFGGVRTKHYAVDGAPYDELLNIIMRECAKGGYSSFNFLIKLEAPFSGIWDGENQISEKALSKMTSRERREARSAGSWIETTVHDPYINSRLIPLMPEQCHPDEFIEQLNHYFGLKSSSIAEIRFKEWRKYEDE